MYLRNLLGVVIDILEDPTYVCEENCKKIEPRITIQR